MSNESTARNLQQESNPESAPEQDLNTPGANANMSSEVTTEIDATTEVNAATLQISTFDAAEASSIEVYGSGRIEGGVVRGEGILQVRGGHTGVLSGLRTEIKVVSSGATLRLTDGVVLANEVVASRGQIDVSGGLTMDDLVWVQVFASDLSYYAAFNTVYRTYFKGPMPARAFLGAGSLLGAAHFEVMGVAVKAGK